MIYLLFHKYFSMETTTDIVSQVHIRTAAAFAMSVFFSLVAYPVIIRKFKKRKYNQKIREYNPEAHILKRETPTVGGLVIISSTLLSCLTWANMKNVEILITLLTLVAFGAIGLYDDIKKISESGSNGLIGKHKFALQIIAGIAIIAVYSLSCKPDHSFLNIRLSLLSVHVFTYKASFFQYICLALFLIIGTSNAVNLTDGLDGLAIVPAIISSILFLIILTMKSFNLAASDCDSLFFIEEKLELSVYCGAAAGAYLGFFWYNSYPASIFMGDTGSLAIGASLAVIAILTKNEIASSLINSVFLIETLSVIAQVVFFKVTNGKRIFKMTPLHHHFELKGYSETKITTRFWSVSMLIGALSFFFANLK